MPGGKFYDKFPAEIIDYEVDCIPALDGGDLIAVDGAAVSSDDLEILADAGHEIDISDDRKSVVFWCTGGEAGRVCKVIIAIWTELGRYRQLPAYVVIKPL